MQGVWDSMVVFSRMPSREFDPAAPPVYVCPFGSLRSAIGLLAADVGTMGGQGGGPRRGARR